MGSELRRRDRKRRPVVSAAVRSTNHRAGSVNMAGLNAPNLDLSVYLVTDSGLIPPGSALPAVVEAAIAGGASIVQLREKELDTRPFVEIATEVLAICRKHGVPLLINDRLDVALAINADGVHIGQSDMPLDVARRLLGDSKVIGVTAETPEQAREALLGGADYLGTAGVFPTPTKVYPEGRGALGIQGLKDILGVLRDTEMELGRPQIPVVAIGGIGPANAAEVLQAAKLAAEGDKPERSLAGIAVVSAIVAQADPKGAAEQLSKIIRPLVRLPTTVVPKSSLPPRPPKAQAFLSAVISLFGALKEKRPLVHSITNFVVMNANANVLLAIGASPIMAHSISEVADVVAFSSAVVVNIGTLAEDTVPSFLAAGLKANQAAVPIVLDPVGAGATPYRQRTARSLVDQVKFQIIKGNAAEISFLAASGEGPQARGVDSEGAVARPEETVRALAKSSGATVAMTGPVDYLTDGKGSTVVRLANGNEWLGRVTGTGCDTAALCGAFAGATKGLDMGEFDGHLVAAAGAILAMGIAAELAVERGVRGPASFEEALFDEIYGLTPDKIARMAKIEVD